MTEKITSPNANNNGVLYAPQASKSLVYTFIFIGILISIVTKDFNWLARSGCLVTLIAIMLTFTLEPDLFRTTQEEPHFKNIVLGNIEPKLDHEHYILKAATIGSKPNEDISRPEVITLRTELALKALKWVLIRQQIRYAMIGTFLWGFGDIPNMLFGWN